MKIVKRIQVASIAAGLLLSIGTGSHGAPFDRLIGAASPFGDAHLVKHFRVPRGSVVVGVEFYSNDLRTTFPKVALLRGPASKLSEAAVLAELTNVRPLTRHRTVVSFAPLRIDTDQDLYVAIRLPASDGIRRLGDGPGIGARNLDGPPTSYFVDGREGALGAMDVDFGIDLIFQSMGKTSAGQGDEPKQAVLRTFLRANSQVSIDATASIEFGLERPGPVSLVVYDVSGRLIRTLARETLAAGTYARGWDGRDNESNGVASGIYFVKLETGDEVLTEKVVRIR